MTTDLSYYPNVGLLGNLKSFLADVPHDVWIAGLAPDPKKEQEPQPNVFDFFAQEHSHRETPGPAISATLATIPALETITLVTDYTWQYQDSSSFYPSLRFIPKSSERAAGSARVRTLRFVSGYSDYDEGCRRLREWGANIVPMKLDLDKLLFEFGRLLR
ncbi:hypothetical protein C8Q80DRAFT_1116712 [Daedaleopsis nitida]|nr:hypothetical protein C8Q80DRAFT_1116712 [Daedaleopsis nitida]